MTEVGDDAFLGFLLLLVDSMRSFDHEAALSATHEQAAGMLKVLKHYIWAIGDGIDVNSDLQFFLTCCGLEPKVPGSVVGGYAFDIRVLMESHKYSGKDCVTRHLRQRKKSVKKKAERAFLDMNCKKLLKQTRIIVKGGAENSRISEISQEGISKLFYLTT